MGNWCAGSGGSKNQTASISRPASGSSSPSDSRAQREEQILEVLRGETFTNWLFGGTARIETLRKSLLTPTDGAFNIVLTNGFANQVKTALTTIGLTGAFRAIIDTRGTALVGPCLEPAGGIPSGRSNKQKMVRQCVLNGEWNTTVGLSTPGIGHLVYVDDSVEHAIIGDDAGDSVCNDFGIGGALVELPNEGSGLDSSLLEQVAQEVTAGKCADGREVCVVWDFDCPLSQKHLFKTFYDKKSRWAKEWNSGTVGETPSNVHDLAEKAKDETAN